MDNDPIRVGLIGCGQRGTAAAINATRRLENWDMVPPCMIGSTDAPRRRSISSAHTQGFINVTLPAPMRPCYGLTESACRSARPSVLRTDSRWASTVPSVLASSARFNRRARCHSREPRQLIRAVRIASSRKAREILGMYSRS